MFGKFPTWLKQLLSVIIILASFAFFIYYWRSHPEIVTQLRQVSLITVVALLGLYACMTFVLVLIYDTVLRMCGKPISLAENSLLTMYSSVINFFGPLQSGPAFRTVYLKQRHGVPVKAYLSGTLVYYATFGILNLAFLAVGISSLISLTYVASFFLSLAVLTFISWYTVRRRAKSGRVGGHGRFLQLVQRFQPYTSGRLFGRLVALAFMQAALVVAIYFIELEAIGNPVTFIQAVAYAGAGSLALFVSLTPGALGFRESFQYISQGLHNVDNNAIVTANLLDRSIYVLFLGILCVVILSFHAKKRLRIPESGIDKDDGHIE